MASHLLGLEGYATTKIDTDSFGVLIEGAAGIPMIEGGTSQDTAREQGTSQAHQRQGPRPRSMSARAAEGPQRRDHPILLS
jgi:hypothetical protein